MPERRPTHKWIVFTSDRNSSADIYRAHPDGTGLERLTDDPSFDDQASLSPDGRTVAFVSTRSAHRTGIFPSYSPNGDRMVVTNGYAAAVHNALVESNADGNNRWITDNCWVDSTPRWLPLSVTQSSIQETKITQSAKAARK